MTLSISSFVYNTMGVTQHVTWVQLQQLGFVHQS